MKIRWTKHAVSRVAERFGFRSDIFIPNKAILRMAGQVEDGSEFRLKHGSVVYVCRRTGSHVTIITVMYAKKEKHSKFESKMLKRLRAANDRLCELEKSVETDKGESLSACAVSALERDAKRFASAIHEWSVAVQREIASRRRSQADSPEIDKYNQRIVFGLELAYSMMLDAMQRQIT